MPQLINRVPPGLLSLLEIKSVGQNLVGLGDTLQATLEMREAYYAAVSQPYQDTTAALGAVGFFGGTISSPPPGEIWVFPTIGIATNTIPAATSYRVKWAIAQLGSGIALHSGSNLAVTTGERLFDVDQGPFYVRSGEQLGVFVSGLTLGVAQIFSIYGRRVIVQI